MGSVRAEESRLINLRRDVNRFFLSHLTSTEGTIIRTVHPICAGIHIYERTVVAISGAVHKARVSGAIFEVVKHDQA